MDNILVTSYNNFENLAHLPIGTPAPEEQTLNLIQSNTIQPTTISSLNPAFVLKHPTKNIIYVCNESITKGTIETYTLNYDNQKAILTKINSVDSIGTSTCFIAIDKKQKNLLVVNYWDSIISIHPLQDGIAQKSIFVYRSKKNVLANHRGDHLNNRQSESHNHSLYFY